MSDERLHEMDPTSAIFAAGGALVKRVLVFFGSCWLSHYVGSNAASAGGFFRSLWQLGPKAILDQPQFNPIMVPAGWLGVLFGGWTHPLGVIYFFIVGICFVTMWLSEDKSPYAIAFLLLAQPIHSFLVDDMPSNPLDLSLGLVILVTWEIGLVGVYWLFFRPSD